jgi:hypothetical protein
LKEYFIYIESVTNPDDDSYNVNKIFQDNKSKSIKSLSRLQLNELFSKILSEYDSKNTINYDLQDIKNIIYSILDKIKINKPHPREMHGFLNNFNKYIAGLTTTDFPNINKIRNLDGYKYPKVYSIEKDSECEKEIKIISGKRNRNQIEIVDYSEKKRKYKKASETNVVTEFLSNLSKDTYSDVVLLRKKESDREIVIEGESRKSICIQDDNKKEFIKTLPSNIFVLLKSKGCVNYSGFLKSINSNRKITKI